MKCLDVNEAILTNIAVREFQDKPVSEEHLHHILNAARVCQSGKNFQPWHFIVIHDRAILNALADMMIGDVDEERTRRAPVAIGLITDPRSEMHIVDTARAAQNMTLDAWALGVGSVFISGPEPPERTIYREKAGKLIDVPEDLKFLELIIFGYPRVWKMVKKKRRKSLREITSLNKFGKTYMQ